MWLPSNGWIVRGGGKTLQNWRNNAIKTDRAFGYFGVSAAFGAMPLLDLVEACPEYFPQPRISTSTLDRLAGWDIRTTLTNVHHVTIKVGEGLTDLELDIVLTDLMGCFDDGPKPVRQ
jgi:hypothetical protein